MLKRGVKKIIALTLVTMAVIVVNPVGANAAWKSNATGWWYTEGIKWANGWRYINNNWYYFDSSGYMKTGWVLDNGKWYYMLPSGEMKKGWLFDGYKWYYLEPSGAMRTGWLEDGLKKYYLNSNGAMAVGKVLINGKEYTFNSSGAYLADSSIKEQDNKVVNTSLSNVSNETSSSGNNESEKLSSSKKNKKETSSNQSDNNPENNRNEDEIIKATNNSGEQKADSITDDGHSIEQVVSRWNALKPKFNGNNIYDQKPMVKAPYGQGKVKDEYLNDTLNYLNFARYVAYVKSTSLDSTLNNQAQYGAVLTTANNILEHRFPLHPKNMSNDFYEKGKESTSSSNLSGGSLYESIQGCLNDDNNLMGSSNIGHREWLLDPKVSKIGFGTTSSYSVHQLPFDDFDSSASKPDYLAWPAKGAFPNSLINRNALWSINLNKSIYNINSNVGVRVTRLWDNKQWNLKKVNYFSGDITGFEILSNNGYGFGSEANTIVFHIGKNDLNVNRYLGKYKVEILGLNKSLEYTINFFELNEQSVKSSDFTQEDDFSSYGNYSKNNIKVEENSKSNNVKSNNEITINNFTKSEENDNDSSEKKIASNEISYDEFYSIACDKMHNLINNYRKKKNISELIIDNKMDNSAYLKSKHMVDNKYFDHDYNGENFDDLTYRLSGQRINGENIAGNWISSNKYTKESAEDLAEKLFTQWKNSPGHNENMLRESFTYFGFGFAIDKKNQVFATQQFGINNSYEQVNINNEEDKEVENEKEDQNIKKIHGDSELEADVYNHFKNHDKVWKFYYYGSSEDNNKEVNQILDKFLFRDDETKEALYGFRTSSNSDNTIFEVELLYYKN